jgi:hypothetical protein
MVSSLDRPTSGNGPSAPPVTGAVERSYGDVWLAGSFIGFPEVGA